MKQSSATSMRGMHVSGFGGPAQSSHLVVTAHTNTQKIMHPTSFEELCQWDRIAAMELGMPIPEYCEPQSAQRFLIEEEVRLQVQAAAERRALKKRADDFLRRSKAAMKGAETRAANKARAAAEAKRQRDAEGGKRGRGRRS